MNSSSIAGRALTCAAVAVTVNIEAGAIQPQAAEVVSDRVSVEQRVVTRVAGVETFGEPKVRLLSLRREVSREVNADGKERLVIGYRDASLDGTKPEWATGTFSVGLPLEAGASVLDEAGAPVATEVAELVSRDAASLLSGAESTVCRSATQRMPQGACEAATGLAVWFNGTLKSDGAAQAKPLQVEVGSPFGQLDGDVQVTPSTVTLRLEGAGRMVTSSGRVSDDVPEKLTVTGESVVRTTIIATRTTGGR